MAQAFRIVAVFLYLTVCALYPDLLVFAVVEIPAGSGFGFLFQYTSLSAVGKSVSSADSVCPDLFRADELVLLIVGVFGPDTLIFSCLFFLSDPVSGSIICVAGPPIVTVLFCPEPALPSGDRPY